MRFILKRVNKEESIVLDTKKCYGCGRDKKNEIVCLSPVVSRRHCIFLHTGDVVQMIDLGSANGTYINGVRIKPKIHVLLNANDLIGIGCFNTDDHTPQDFIYRLEPSTDETIDNDSLLSTSKRKLDITEPVIPPKIRRIEDVIVIDDDESICPKQSNANVAPTSPQVFDDEENELVRSPPKPRKICRTEENEQVSNKKRKIEESSRIVDISKEIENGVLEVIHHDKDDEMGGDDEGISIEILNGEPEEIEDRLLDGLQDSKKRHSLVPRSGELDITNESFNFNKFSDLKVTSTPAFKALKEEPRLSYSQIEGDGFTDDEEDIFSASQKSDSAHNTPDRVDQELFENNKDSEHKDLFHCQDEEDGVIVLSDDDDDDNPWLSRLYHSQMLNESQIKMEKAAETARLGDALADLKRLSFPEEDEVDKAVKDETKKKSKSSDDNKKSKESSRDRKKHDTKPSKQKASSHNEHSDDSRNRRKSRDSHSDDSERKRHKEKENKRSSHKTSDSTKSDRDSKKSSEIKEKSTEFVEKSGEIDGKGGKILDKVAEEIEEVPPVHDKISEFSEKIDDKSTSPALPTFSTKSFYTSPKSRIDDQKGLSFEEASRRVSLELLSRRLSTDKSSAVSRNERKIPTIDAPYLAKGEQRGVSCNIKRLSMSTEGDASSLNEEHSDSSDFKSPKSRIISAKERKEHEMQEKIEDQRFKIEQKRRRLQYKWAADALPPSSRRRSSLSKSIKEEIKQDRKEKLKKLAEAKKDTSEELPARKPAKPKAKVSTKTRGDFLIAEQESKDKSKEESLSKSTESLDVQNAKTSPKIPKIPKIKKISPNQSKSAEPTSEPQIQTLDTKNIALREPTVRLIDIFVQEKEEQKKKEKSKEKDKDRRREKEKSKTRSRSREKSSREKNREKDTEKGKDKDKEKENVAPNDTKKKRVTFCTAKPEVREFEIDPGNTMKKVVHKDALLPAKFSRKEKVASQVINNPKLEEFLLRIFQWNPLWLSEQMSIKEEPPVVDHKNLKPLLSSYSSYDDYYKITAPLLALEVWHSISREYEQGGCQPKHPPIPASIVANSLTRNPVPSTNLFVSTFMVEALVTKDQFTRSLHPVMGDLAIFRIAVKRQEGTQHHNIFAYVTNVLPTTIAPFTRYNKALADHVENPHTLLTYTMMTKPLSSSVEVDNVQKLSTISYLRSSMRMIQALQYLPTSPLLKQILQPNVHEYQLPNNINMENYALTTKDRLNTKQMEAVLKITETVVQRLPKICIIQGPPGTGKSKVIVNAVTEILYGNNRYAHHKQTRILVCAPSNAAIDEIVLRLMDIRTNLPKDQRFKMVRTGKQESMHKLVKSISVPELAKREVERMTTEFENEHTMESIEEEKNFLKARINAFETELSYATSKGENYRQYVLRKLQGVQMKYDLLTKPRGSNATINPRERMKLQRAAESTILSCADVIACTLSSCYTNQMESIFGCNKDKISVCIVDEATQSAEAETLIPLMLGVSTLVLVGDPQQLPATVISQEAKRLGLDQSLFARLYTAFDGEPTNPVILLDTQYRMSYSISYWPNRYFYAGALKNSAHLLPLPFHMYKVLNLCSTQNSDRFSNTHEAIFIANLIVTMLTLSNLGTINGFVRVGIITPYNNQRNALNNMLREKTANIPENVRKKLVIEVNTVDSFQGQERDVIIMSTVRTQGIGFLNNRQRLCVALTRAKHSLFIVGNFKTFERDDMWKALLADARSRGVLVDVNHNAPPIALKTHIVK